MPGEPASIAIGLCTLATGLVLATALLTTRGDESVDVQANILATDALTWIVSFAGSVACWLLIPISRDGKLPRLLDIIACCVGACYCAALTALSRARYSEVRLQHEQLIQRQQALFKYRNAEKLPTNVSDHRMQSLPRLPACIASVLAGGCGGLAHDGSPIAKFVTGVAVASLGLLHWWMAIGFGASLVIRQVVSRRGRLLFPTVAISLGILTSCELLLVANFPFQSKELYVVSAEGFLATAVFIAVRLGTWKPRHLLAWTCSHELDRIRRAEESARKRLKDIQPRRRANMRVRGSSQGHATRVLRKDRNTS